MDKYSQKMFACDMMLLLTLVAWRSYAVRKAALISIVAIQFSVLIIELLT